MVNLENPAPDDFSHHPSGLVFTMDPGLLVGLAGAGIDAVSLANNHIGNAGGTGVTDTIENVIDVGIRPFGAGRDATAARQPAWLTAKGLSIAMLGYDGVASGADATDGRPGAARLDPAAAEADIRTAREAGADVVVVVPHWGSEYTDDATDEQRRIASRLVEAGADVILGSHSHWAGPLEFVDDHLVVYSVGDLVFDLEHDARTQQGVILDLTFAGPRRAQVELHPTLILDDSQPNLLERDGGGLDLLDAIARASSAADLDDARSRARLRGARIQEPLEAVEDEIEPELELAHVGVG
jgi:poly-gamma-glutamate synthesis protein (capsule biosynthesis protein)